MTATQAQYEKNIKELQKMELTENPIVGFLYNYKLQIKNDLRTSEN